MRYAGAQGRRPAVITHVRNYGWARDCSSLPPLRFSFGRGQRSYVYLLRGRRESLGTRLLLQQITSPFSRQFLEMWTRRLCTPNPPKIDFHDMSTDLTEIADRFLYAAPGLARMRVTCVLYYTVFSLCSDVEKAFEHVMCTSVASFAVRRCQAYGRQIQGSGERRPSGSRSQCEHGGILFG